MSAPRVRGILDEALRDGPTDSMASLLFVPGPSFQRVDMLAVEHDLTSLVMHCRPRGYDAGVSLRCQLDDFEVGIQRVPGMHLLQESTRGARKRKKLVADVLRKEGGANTGQNQQRRANEQSANEQSEDTARPGANLRSTAGNITRGDEPERLHDQLEVLADDRQVLHRDALLVQPSHCLLG